MIHSIDNNPLQFSSSGLYTKNNGNTWKEIWDVSDAQKELHVQSFKWALTCKPGASRHTISDGKAIDMIMQQAIDKWNTYQINIF